MTAIRRCNAAGSAPTRTPASMTPARMKPSPRRVQRPLCPGVGLPGEETRDAEENHGSEVEQQGAGHTPCVIAGQQRHQPASYRFTSSPTPSMDIRTDHPSFIAPAPMDVPQAMMSPGCNVMSWEIRLTISRGP